MNYRIKENPHKEGFCQSSLVGNVRIVACQCPFEGSQRLMIFTVSPTDSTNKIIIP